MLSMFLIVIFGFFFKKIRCFIYLSLSFLIFRVILFNHIALLVPTAYVKYFPNLG